MKNLIRLGAISTLAMAAAFASALTLHFQTTGSFIDAVSFSATDTTVSLADSTVTAASLDFLNYEFTKGAGIALIPGSYTITNGHGTLSLNGGADTVDFNLQTGLGAPTAAPAGLEYTSNQAGILSFANGTGIFAGLVGSGVLSFNTQASSGSNQGSTTTNFDATFEAVPEPASMAVLGIGALGFLAKRRRK